MRIMRIPSVAKTSSKTLVNLLSRSRIKKWNPQSSGVIEFRSSMPTAAVAVLVDGRRVKLRRARSAGAQPWCTARRCVCSPGPADEKLTSAKPRVEAEPEEVSHVVAERFHTPFRLWSMACAVREDVRMLLRFAYLGVALRVVDARVARHAELRIVDGRDCLLVTPATMPRSREVSLVATGVPDTEILPASWHTELGSRSGSAQPWFPVTASRAASRSDRRSHSCGTTRRGF